MLMRSDLLCGVTAVAIIACAIPAPAIAQQQSYRFDIPAQPLDPALRSFAQVTRLQVIFDGDVTRDKTSRPLAGTYNAEEALSLMLAGTDLRAHRNAEGVIVVTRAEGQRELPSGESDAGQGPAASASAEADDREIVVTGSLIRGAAPSGANLIMLAREDLDATGRGTLADAIQTTPQVHGGGINDSTTRTGSGAAPNDFGNVGGYGSASINLRGLGVEETLTLVNGRRLAPAGYHGSIADISALPMAAVERVEILADGASATYGADAMAGVVNIIMNRRFEGAETRLRAGLETRSGQPELQASQTFGWAFDRGNILLSADYTRRDGVTEKGRPYAASADLRPFGGSDHRLNYCNPGNIVSPSPTELIGAIPAGQDGRALTPDQIRRGETNRCDIYPDSSYLTPETEKGSVYLTGSYNVTDRLRLSADLIVSQRSTTQINLYQTSDLAVPVSNAFRQMNGLHGDTAPLNQPISVRYLFTEVGPRTRINEIWSLLGAVTAEYDLDDNWHLSLSGSFARYDSKAKDRTLDRSRLAQALASSDPATAFNPFGNGSVNNRELIESFFYPNHELQESDHRSVSLSFSGSLLDLPGGAMKLALGSDYRRENLGFQLRDFFANLAPGFQDSYIFDAGRDTSAAYAELFIPLFSEGNAVTGARRLSVSLSGRYDHYSDFGGTFNPKAGVTWMPVDGLMLKGSYGSSFRVPLLTSLYDMSYASFFLAGRSAGAPDVDGDGFITTMIVAGGNPDLGPEKGKSWTAGVEIEPAALPGARLHATYFNLRFTGRFSQAPTTSAIFAEPAAYQGIAYFPSPPQSQVDSWIASVDLVRGGVPPTGSIEAILDLRTKNFASQVMDGLDAGASYRWEGLGGTFNLSGDVSYLFRYRSRLGQSVTVTSYIGNVGLPTRWKARGGFGWTDEDVSFSSWINHMAGYTNKLVTPHEPVSSYTTVDLSLQAQLSGWARGLVGDGASLAFYVTNLLDQAPPFVNNPYGVGYDGANADPIGRRVAVQLTKRW